MTIYLQGCKNLYEIPRQEGCHDASRKFRSNYCHLFMTSNNSDYFFFMKIMIYDPFREYQFVNHVVYVTRRYKSVVLDKKLHKPMSLLAIIR